MTVWKKTQMLVSKAVSDIRLDPYILSQARLDFKKVIGPLPGNRANRTRRSGQRQGGARETDFSNQASRYTSAGCVIGLILSGNLAFFME